jgi:hypothetical protein
MRLFSKLIAGATILGLSAAMLLSFGGAAQADCYQYNPNGFTTSSTPVFNNICGAPEGVNNESDFVRLRQSTNGNDIDNVNNPAYTVGSLSAACNTGDKFDVWNYLHNDASQDDNDNGTGSAIAHDVKTDMTAPLGSTNNSFTFGDTVTASNAATVQDSATLNCGSQQVKLTLVPSSVHIYSIPYAAWENMSDSTLNTPTSIGSPSMGSGDMWGCWNYRMVIVYEVTVQRITPTPPPVTFACTDLGLTAEDNRTVKISNFTTTQSGTDFAYAVIDWDDQTPNLTTTTANSSPVGQTHQYANNGTYVITATAYFTNGSSATSPACTQQALFTGTTPPTITPPTTTTTTTTPPPAAPTALVNTGPGSVLGLFAATTLGGAAYYRRMLARRLTRH